MGVKDRIYGMHIQEKAINRAIAPPHMKKDKEIEQLFDIGVDVVSMPGTSGPLRVDNGTADWEKSSLATAAPSEPP